jgi:hypothetical protein
MRQRLVTHNRSRSSNLEGNIAQSLHAADKAQAVYGVTLRRKYLSREYEILLTLDPNYKEYDLFKIRRSHLGNPGVVVGSEARFLLQDMNLALHFRHLVV